MKNRGAILKKHFAVALLAFAAALAPAAAQTGTVAVGPVYSVNFLGIQSPLGGLGVTGKIPGLSPVVGFNFSLSNKESRYFMGITADWLMYKQPLYQPFNLNFYLGPGFYTSLLMDSINNDERASLSGTSLSDAMKNQINRFDLGLRIPVGINWVPLKFFETFLEVTPAFGITFQDPIAPSWLFQSALGARVWF